MTPAQTSTYEIQQRPENRYTVHPDIDGCIPAVALTIRAVEPADVHRELGEGTTTITIRGTGFAGAARVKVLDPSVPTDTVTVQGSTHIRRGLRRSNSPKGPSAGHAVM